METRHKGREIIDTLGQAVADTLTRFASLHGPGSLELRSEFKRDGKCYHSTYWVDAGNSTVVRGEFRVVAEEVEEPPVPSSVPPSPGVCEFDETEPGDEDGKSTGRCWVGQGEEDWAEVPEFMGNDGSQRGPVDEH